MISDSPSIQDEYFELYTANSDKTLTVFGGLGHQIGQPMFEFRKSLKPLNVNLLFFKDMSRSWYHAPISGFGDTILDKSKRISEILDTLPGTSRLFMGSSAGGFAALMFSRLVPDVRDCLLFGPQVFIDHRTRRILRDSRWPRLMNQIEQEKFLNIHEITNLQSCPTRIIVGDNCEEDMRHALYARAHIDADIHVLTRAGHNPAGELKSAGVLTEILGEFLRGDRISDRKALKIHRRMAQLRTL